MIRASAPRLKALLLPGLLCLLSAAYVWIFSYSTSPFYPAFFGRDSAEFLTIGREWSLGRIPYRDLFDHKGPWIFLINCISFLLTGSKTGVSLLQILFLAADLEGIRRIAEALRSSRLFQALSLALFLLLLRLCYCQGDTVEEFCLPFLIWSEYFLLRYFLTDARPHSHPARYAAFYGISFGICLMSRLTNFIPLIPAILFICTELLLEKNYKDFIRSAAAAFFGVLCPVLPFSLYFLKMGCFREFADGTLLFNIRYASRMTSWLLTADTAELRWFCLVYCAFLFLFPTALLLFLRNSFRLGSLFILTGILEAFLFFSGADYSQYVLICAPQPVFLLALVCEMLEAGDISRRITGYAGLFLLLMSCQAAFQDYVLPARELHHQYSHHEQRGWEGLTARIPAEDSGSFVVYGYSELQEVYLLSGLHPGCRYFILQEWQSSFSEAMSRSLTELYESAPVKWILTDGHTDRIADSLSRYYEIFDTAGNFILYRQKTN